MQVLECTTPAEALVVSRDDPHNPRRVNTQLLDSPPVVGDWLMIHVDIAIQTLTEQAASDTADAILAVTRAARGESFEHLLGDLIDREPQLPAHLRSSVATANE